MAKRIAKTISLFDLMTKYPTEQHAIDYLESIRWGDSPFCTRCGCDSKIKADEFTFRLNEGNCQIDTEGRMVSLFKGMVGKTITYQQLTA